MTVPISLLQADEVLRSRVVRHAPPRAPGTSRAHEGGYNASHVGLEGDAAWVHGINYGDAAQWGPGAAPAPYGGPDLPAAHWEDDPAVSASPREQHARRRGHLSSVAVPTNDEGDKRAGQKRARTPEDDETIAAQRQVSGGFPALPDSGHPASPLGPRVIDGNIHTDEMHPRGVCSPPLAPQRCF